MDALGSACRMVDSLSAQSLPFSLYCLIPILLPHHILLPSLFLTFFPPSSLSFTCLMKNRANCLKICKTYFHLLFPTVKYTEYAKSPCSLMCNKSDASAYIVVEVRNFLDEGTNVQTNKRTNKPNSKPLHKQPCFLDASTHLYKRL